MDILDDAGYLYDVAVSGKEARDFLQQKRYDGVIMDISLPSGDKSLLPPPDLPQCFGGLPILKKIVDGEFDAIGNTNNLPVVIITGIGLPKIINYIRSLCDNPKKYYFIKPCDFFEIIEILKEDILPE